MENSPAIKWVSVFILFFALMGLWYIHPALTTDYSHPIQQQFDSMTDLVDYANIIVRGEIVSNELQGRTTGGSDLWWERLLRRQPGQPRALSFLVYEVQAVEYLKGSGPDTLEVFIPRNWWDDGNPIPHPSFANANVGDQVVLFLSNIPGFPTQEPYLFGFSDGHLNVLTNQQEVEAAFSQPIALDEIIELVGD